MHRLQRNPAIEGLARHSPNTRVTVEQSNYPDYLQSQQRSNPYADYCAILEKCSEKIQLQIISDPRFTEKQDVCENLIKQFLYSRVIPDVLQIPEGKLAFEELLSCTQALKNHYAQEAVEEQKNVVDQTKKIQEQEQQIFVLASEMKRMKMYIDELLAQKTEPTDPAVQAEEDVK